MWPQDFEVVADLCDSADGGACGADGVALLDGNGWGDILDAIDSGSVHAIEELAGVRGEGFDIAPLALGIEGVESE